MRLKEKYVEGHIKPSVARLRSQNRAHIVTKIKNDTTDDSDTLCLLGWNENEQT